MMHISATSGMNPNNPIAKINVPKTSSIMCPTDILTAKRMVKLNGLAKSDNVSTGIISGAIIHGKPSGKKVCKYLKPRCLMPKYMSNIKNKTDKVQTAAICEVNVKLYGKSPIMLPMAINVNSAKISEKYFKPSRPKVSPIMPCITVRYGSMRVRTRRRLY